MAKTSVIIPARGERWFLQRTIDDLLAKAAGDIEIITVLDGYWPDPPLRDDPRLIVVHRPEPRGMRASIAAAAAVASGQFLMKTDAHCMFAEGFDETLKADCDADWLVIPSRYSLDAENWAILDTGKSRVDYHYLCCPFNNKKDDDPGMHGQVWNERARSRKDNPAYDIDDEMSFQGSCWFVRRRYFFDSGGMPEEEYGGFIQEPQQLGLKVWLGGGRIVVNKRTWYAHLHKGKTYGRGYSMSGGEMHRGSIYSTDYWLNNRWPGRVRDFAWLLEKFWPVPSWPDDWQEKWEKIKHRWHKTNGRWEFDGRAA